MISNYNSVFFIYNGDKGLVPVTEYYVLPFSLNYIILDKSTLIPCFPILLVNLFFHAPSPSIFT